MRRASSNGALAASPAVRSESRGSCARAEIPWQSTLPDGTTRDAGALTLCLQQMYNPAAGLHEIRLDGSPVGMFMSRARESEGLYSRSPVLIFQRDEGGEHTLIGYAMPDGDVMQTYTLHPFGKRPPEVASLFGEFAPGTTAVRVAALVD